MIINTIPSDIFNQHDFNDISIIDSGFNINPSLNTTLYTKNTFNRKHGSKVLQILSFNNTIPHFHLSSIIPDISNPVLHAVNSLPDTPILNLSLSWNHHDNNIYHSLFNKFKFIFCAFNENTFPTIYKSSHPNQLFTISNNIYHKADFIIPLNSIFNFSGNSSVTPLFSNLFSHNQNFFHINSLNNNIPLSSILNNDYTKKTNKHNLSPISCYHCGYINNPNNSHCSICNSILKK